MRIANPNHKQAPSGQGRPTASGLTTAERNQLKAAVQAAVNAWPADDAAISVHRLAVAVRMAPGNKLDPAKFDGADITALLGELGYTLEN